MKYTGEKKVDSVISIKNIATESSVGEQFDFHGAVHKIRDMGDFAFVIVRLIDGVIQCVWTKDESEFDVKDLCEEACVNFTGIVHAEERAPHGYEVDLKNAKVLSSPAAPLPIIINKGKLKSNLDTLLNYRPASLRASEMRAKFKIQDGIVKGFREYLSSQGFTEIHTPKLVAASAEGGANVFKMEYFGRKAFLNQSPQFYKQTMVPVYERVFEIGPVFRAEKHSTIRHLNEYTSLDFEIGYIDSFEDIMEIETEFLKYTFTLLKENYTDEIKLLKINIPEIDRIPCVKFNDAKEMVSKEYNRRIKDPNDLEPEEEQLICKLFKDKFNSDFVFVTHYPSKKRPFYAMDDPENPNLTLSFDLLFNGIEITTGGQRIHDYDMQVEKMISKNLNPEDFESYLMLHKFGVPPHGGLGIGLERFLMCLCRDDNVRKSSLFPRDLNRIEP
ncbi:MAG TPA: aspartate--tRNA(Asn) ligase [Clostridia bacterium]|nr:aspartate--tRNA(Asn) ligase [Clostridia bacterium]